MPKPSTSFAWPGTLQCNEGWKEHRLAWIWHALRHVLFSGRLLTTFSGAVVAIGLPLLNLHAVPAWRIIAPAVIGTVVLLLVQIQILLYGCDHARRLETLAVDNWSLQKALVELKADDDSWACKSPDPLRNIWNQEGREHPFDESTAQLNDTISPTCPGGTFVQRRWNLLRHIFSFKQQECNANKTSKRQAEEGRRSEVPDNTPPDNPILQLPTSGFNITKKAVSLTMPRKSDAEDVSVHSAIPRKNPAQAAREARRTGNLPVSRLLLMMFKHYRANSSTYASGLPQEPPDFKAWEDRLEQCWFGLRTCLEKDEHREVRLVPFAFDVFEAEHIQLNSTGSPFQNVFKTVFYQSTRSYHEPLWSLARGFYLSRNWHAFSFGQSESRNAYQHSVEARRRECWYETYHLRRGKNDEVKLDSQAAQTYLERRRFFLLCVTLHNLEWLCSWYKCHFFTDEVGSDKQLKRAPERFEDMWIRLMGNVDDICDEFPSTSPMRCTNKYQATALQQLLVDLKALKLPFR